MPASKTTRWIIGVAAGARGPPASCNREAAPIEDGLRKDDRSTEDLLELVACVRGDDSDVSLGEATMAELLNSAETIRAE